jgi:hypothetical protein
LIGWRRNYKTNENKRKRQMIEWTEEFCEVDGYRCMMPIEYELVSKTLTESTYKKVKCNCHNVREGKCDRGMECPHFIIAKEIIIEKN